MEPKLDRPKSLTDLAVERIREAIVEGRLGFGEQVSEVSLAAQLGISKTPVREALLRLRPDGLVEIHPQRGTFVFRVTQQQVVEICRFREIIEAAALAEAMTRDRAALVARLEANLAEMGEAHARREMKRLPQVDAEFHGSILECCGNAYLRAAYSLIEHKIHALRWRLPERNAQVEHCQHNHAVILAQVRDGSVARAQAILQEHIRDTLEAYLEASRLASPARAPAALTPAPASAAPLP